MLLTLKALLISGALLTQGDLPLQDRAIMILGQDTFKATQDTDYHRAVELTSKSSYVDLIKDDSELAAQLLQEACSLGYGRACWYYAFKTEDEKDILHAKEVLVKSCFAGETQQNGESCTFLGIMASQEYLDIEQSERELYERACRLNDGWGCYRLAYDYIADKDMEQAKKVGEKALDLLTKSCENGNASGCYFAGSIYSEPLTPNWLKDSDNKAQYYYDKGCRLGDGDSCENANTYDEGE